MASPDRVDRRPRLINPPSHNNDPRLNIASPVTDRILGIVKKQVAEKERLKGHR